MSKEQPRFIMKKAGKPRIGYEQCIIVDRETGVNYLWVSGSGGYAGGLTPLLGADGKPIVTPVMDDD